MSKVICEECLEMVEQNKAMYSGRPCVDPVWEEERSSYLCPNCYEQEIQDAQQQEWESRTAETYGR